MMFQNIFRNSDSKKDSNRKYMLQENREKLYTCHKKLIYFITKDKLLYYLL